MAKTVKDYKEWIDTYENPTESEKELIDGFKDILDEIFANHKKELAEKDKEFGLLVTDRDKLEMYRHNQLKKSDFRKEYICLDCGTIGNRCFNINDDTYCDNFSNDSTDIQEFSEFICLKKNSKYESLED